MTKSEALNRYYPLKDIFEDIGLKTHKSNIRCEFHQDTKPSAHIYDNRVWCFTCNRFYYVMDYVKKYKLDINKYYNILLESMSEEEMESGFNSNTIEDIRVLDKTKGFIEFSQNFFK